MNGLNIPVVTFKANERRPSCLRDFTTSNNPKFTGGLWKEVSKCEGSRVMMVRNVDVQDGFCNIGITHVFSCVNICWVPRKLFEHEAVNAMKQTCVVVILAYFT